MLSIIVYGVVSVLQHPSNYNYILGFIRAITCGKYNYMPHTGNPGKVLLIVDNSSLIIERLIGILGEVKKIKKIFTANDYTGAVTVLGEKETDIVLLDIQLPGKNGIDLLKFIVKDHPAVKVVMLTNLVSDYYQKLCRKIGAVHFMDKSKDFERIPRVVARL